MSSNAHASDAMIRRLETELREKMTLVNGIIERANAAERDLTEQESSIISDARGRAEEIKGQLEQLEDMNRVAFEAREKSRQVDDAIATMKGRPLPGQVEYRTAGQFALDMYRSAMGDRNAKDRLEIFHRQDNGAHQVTGDDLAGVLPDPIVGDVINFIDGQRPIVAILGPRALPGESWYRPIVTGHTVIETQDEQKTELSSQPMKITRIPAEAKTYGGYVNISRQAIDFTRPSIMDLVITDLATQYAIETEAAVADAIAGVTTTAKTHDGSASSLASALWDAAAAVFSAVRGAGSLVLAVSPSVLKDVGPLFQPVNPQNAQSTGFTAASYGQGVLGSISGIRVVMSSGFGNGDAYLFSTSAIEVYEQRIGALQVTEPSVLGVQVAYAGYFVPLVIESGAIVPVKKSG